LVPSRAKEHDLARADVGINASLLDRRYTDASGGMEAVVTVYLTYMGSIDCAMPHWKNETNIPTPSSLLDRGIKVETHDKSVVNTPQPQL